MARPHHAVAAAQQRREQAEVDGGRLCGGCQTWVPKEGFTPSTWDSAKVGSCRECIKARNRRDKLKALYGLTEQAYDALFIGQGGLCALCRTASEKPLVVDHNHATGAIRGLLCVPCNSALGRLGDDEDGLQRALAYVRGTWS